MKKQRTNVKKKTKKKCFFFPQASEARAAAADADAAIARTRRTTSASTLSLALPSSGEEARGHAPPWRVMATRQSLPAAVAALRATVGPRCCPPATKKSPRVVREGDEGGGGRASGGDPKEQQGGGGEAEREREAELAASSPPPSSEKNASDANDAGADAGREAPKGTQALAASGLRRSTFPRLESPTSTLEKASPRLWAAAVSLRMWGTTWKRKKV